MKTRFILIVFLLNISCILISQIIHVPDDHPTIQEGINAASNGDTVLVADGNYLENINFKGKAISLASHFILDDDTAHINNTVIDGSQPSHPDSASVVSFISGEDTTSMIWGFTITGGGGLFFPSSETRAGGGIICWSSGAKIMHNRIINNEVNSPSNSFGGGIAASNYIKWLLIENNIISNNGTLATTDLVAAGGGLYLNTNARVLDNVIEENNCESESFSALGGGIYCFSEESLMNILEFKNNKISNNHVIGNSGNVYGGGLYALWSELRMSKNEINNNTLTGLKAWGGGLCIVQSAGKIDLSENEIINNEISVDEFWVGCGIYISYPDAKTVMIKNVISGNSGSGNSWGGGINISYSLHNAVIFDGNYISNNSAVTGGGLHSRDVLNCSFTNNVFSNNNAGGSGGAVFLKESSKDDHASKFAKTSSARLLDSTHFAMINNTFFNNIASSYGGAVCCNYIIETINIINSIFWENEASTGTDVHHSGFNDINISYSNIYTAGIDGNWTGINNINFDPFFVDPTNGDFHLDSCASHCINAGIDSLEINETWFYSPATDIDNEERPYDNTFPDMGADETSCLLITEIFNQETYASSLLKSFPNPFKHQTTIEICTHSTDFVLLSIIDFAGKEIKTLVSNYLHNGIHQFEWNAEGLQPGIYFLRLEANGISETRKLIKIQ